MNETKGNLGEAWEAFSEQLYLRMFFYVLMIKDVDGFIYMGRTSSKKNCDIASIK